VTNPDLSSALFSLGYRPRREITARRDDLFSVLHQLHLGPGATPRVASGSQSTDRVDVCAHAERASL